MTGWLIFVAGLTAFGGEVALTRVAERLLGNTNATLATVLATWMLGLALGARIASPRAWSASQRYRVAQVGLGIALIVAPRLLRFLGEVPIALDASFVTWRLLPVALVLLLPATAAGYAFPAMVGMTARRSDRQHRAHGELGWTYGLETGGGVAGALLAGFYLYRHVGALRSLDLLGLFAVLSALASWGVSRVRPDRIEEASDPASTAVDESGASGRRELIAIGMAGGAVLGLELLWTRLLLFFIPGLVSALAAMMAGIVLGSALGGMVGSRMGRLREGGRRFGSVALLVSAVGGGISLYSLPLLATVVRWFPTAPRGGYDAGGEMVASVGVALLVAITTTVGSSIALALLTASIGGATERSGARAYAASSFGSALGVVVASIVAGNLLSIRDTAMAASLVLVLAAMVAWRPRLDSRLVPIGALSATLFVVGTPRRGALIEQSTLYYGIDASDRTTVAVEEDGHVVASVVDLGGDKGRALYTNAFLAASTESHYGYMRMLAHLPALLARDNERALVIAYGTGTTAGSLSLHSGLKRLDIAELSPAVLRVAPYFQSVNRGVPYDPKLRDDLIASVHYGDGREFLERLGDAYDVITLEPLPPNVPAAVHFYTAEFYQHGLARLRPGGMLCQWIPIHVSPVEDLKTMVHTFAATMPQAWLFLFDQCALLIGTGSAGAKFPVVRALERVGSVDVRRDLHAANMEGLAPIFGAFVAGRERLLVATKNQRTMTDDRPDVALGYAQPNRLSLRNIEEACTFLLAAREPIDPWLDWDGVDAATQERLQSEIRGARRAKEELLEYRRDLDRSRLVRALTRSSDDLEALALLGQKSPFNPDVPTSRQPGGAGEIGKGLKSDERGELLEAIDAAGLTDGVDWRRLLPLLDHGELEVRMRSMVALHRRIGDVSPYDPSSSSAARKAAIAAIERRNDG